MWSLDDIYKIGHCDMVLLSALAVLDQIDFHKVEAYNKTESQTEKVRNVPTVPNDSYRFWADLPLEGHV